MQNFDIDILKRNVQKLMDEHGTKQEELADYLGMSQPNVSKALNLKYKKCFTLEQACRISDFYNVSVDYLVGKRTTYSAANNREIVDLLITLIESGKVSFSEVNMTEQVYPEPFPHESSDPYNKEMQYPALFFRDYWLPGEEDVDGSQFADILAGGNSTGNYSVNDFLRKFIQVYTLRQKGDLYDETYKAVVHDYLSRIW